jgi:hypothetical protein
VLGVADAVCSASFEFERPLPGPLPPRLPVVVPGVLLWAVLEAGEGFGEIGLDPVLKLEISPPLKEIDVKPVVDVPLAGARVEDVVEGAFDGLGPGARDWVVGEALGAALEDAGSGSGGGEVDGDGAGEDESWEGWDVVASSKLQVRDWIKAPATSGGKRTHS